MFSIRIRDSPYKKRLSTLEEGSRVKVRCPGMAFLGNPEFGVGSFPIHLVKFAKVCNSKEYAIKEPKELSSKMDCKEFWN